MTDEPQHALSASRTALRRLREAIDEIQHHVITSRLLLRESQQVLQESGRSRATRTAFRRWIAAGEFFAGCIERPSDRLAGPKAIADARRGFLQRRPKS